MADSGFDIAMVGSHAYGLFMNCERLPAPGESIIGWDFRQPEDGGKGSNQAICAGRLGASVLFIGKVGEDAPGELLARRFRENNVDARFLYRTADTYTGVGFVLVDRRGEVVIASDLGANAKLLRSEIEATREAMQRARFFMTQFELPPELALFSLRLAKGLGLTTVLTPAPMPTLAGGSLDCVDIVTPNETEAKLLAGHDLRDEVGPAELADRIRRRWGIANVVVTLGARGVHALCGGERHELPAFRVEAVNTTGAGDAFTAGLVVALCRGAAWRTALEVASAVAAISVQDDATWRSYPTVEHVRAFLGKRGLSCPW